MGRDKHCKQIPLACVGNAHSVLATLGLFLLTECVLSHSILLRLQVALQGNCLKPTLGCMHFPGLSCSGTGSWVLHKGLHFVPFPGPSSSGHQILGGHTLPRLGRESYHLPGPSHWVSWVRSGRAVFLFWRADLWLRPSRWMPTIQDPRKTWLATGSQLAVWQGMPTLWPRLPFSGSGCHLPASLPLARDGLVCSQLALLWYSLSPLFCEQVSQCLRLALFIGKFSLSLSFLSLSGYPTVWAAISH